MRKCFFRHEKETNLILPKSGLKYLVAVTTSITKTVWSFGKVSSSVQPVNLTLFFIL